jgi:CheY-like chemotaxis protein
MTALLIVVLFAVFLITDLAVRAISKRASAARELRERTAVLKSALQMNFASEAKSLKRAEVQNARASILAVDDEAIVLDSFRKILVLAGFSVDTVENGPEALTLLRARPYDFLFTDLKMPDMNGVEVVKAARDLRPDLDIAVITGFGSIETAVETMQYGAVDYVQKPFTEDELVAFANRLAIRREARLEAQRRPTVRVVAPALAEVVSSREYCVPGGAFLYPGHTWAQIATGGQVWVGLDDFARKALKTVEHVDLPAAGTRVRRGDLLFVVRRGEEIARLRSPVSGEVTQVNPALQRDPAALMQSPYDRGWVCVIAPSDLATELLGLRIGKPVVAWYQEEIARLRKESPGGDGAAVPWRALESGYFGPGIAHTEPVTDVVTAGS